MIQAFGALTLNGFREARRNRVTVVLALFALGLIFTSSLVTEAVVATMHRVLVDIGLGSMSIILGLLAIFLSSSLISREIERRTIFMIVSKPVSRATFLVARFAGNMLTIGVLLALMGLLFCLELVVFAVPITSMQLVAIAMLWFELLVISSVGFLMSSFSSQLVSTFVTFGVFISGYLADEVYTLGQKSNVASVKLFSKVGYYLMPNLGRLNHRPQATHGYVPDPVEVLSAMAYGCAYAGVVIALAVFVFSRRDFK